MSTHEWPTCNGELLYFNTCTTLLSQSLLLLYPLWTLESPLYNGKNSHCQSCGLANSVCKLSVLEIQKCNFTVPPDHLLLDSAPNLGPLISRWEINKFENCWYKIVRILEVIKLLFQQFLNLSSSQRAMGGPILGGLSNNRWSGGISSKFYMDQCNLISLMCHKWILASRMSLWRYH